MLHWIDLCTPSLRPLYVIRYCHQETCVAARVACECQQVTTLLHKELVEEAVLLAETIAAVEASKDQRMAEQVRSLI